MIGLDGETLRSWCNCRHHGRHGWYARGGAAPIVDVYAKAAQGMPAVEASSGGARGAPQAIRHLPALAQVALPQRKP